MKNSLIVGMAIGMAAGACIASNSYKAREAVRNTQGAIKSKLCAQKQADSDCGCGCEGDSSDTTF